jgi:hypothetical protein
MRLRVRACLAAIRTSARDCVNITAAHALHASMPLPSTPARLPRHENEKDASSTWKLKEKWALDLDELLMGRGISAPERKALASCVIDLDFLNATEDETRRVEQFLTTGRFDDA